MTKTILTSLALMLLLQLSAQNLVVNPDAESLPRGTGWTIISQGALGCVFVPTDNFTNWTLKPNGNSNYPYDHTTGASGGTVFFSGCDTYFQGPFEAQQTIDVSADAALIDLGNQPYAFSGYMQTPVTNQSDEGRYTVDFLNASNAVLGTSYTSGWQNYFSQGTAWTQYSNTRLAPPGTRSIRIRMFTQLQINQPAINAYFDDISLTKPNIVLPVSLLSFTGKIQQNNILLNWEITNDPGLQLIELEQSSDGSRFSRISSFAAGNTSYHYTDQYNNQWTGKYFYRLKMIATTGQITYSNIILLKTSIQDLISLSPNPADNIAVVSGNFVQGSIAVINYSGQTVLSITTTTSPARLDISGLPNGLYVVRFSDQKNSVSKKLLVQHK